MRGKVDTPGKCGCGYENLDVLVSEQILDQSTVHSGHAGMVDGKAVGQKVLELRILGILCLLPQHLVTCTVLPHECPNSVLLQTHVSDCTCRLACLLSAVHEDQDLLLASIFHHLLVNDLIGYLEPLERLLLRNADIGLVEGHGSEAVVKVEEALVWLHAQERGHILVVGQRGTQTNKTGKLLCGLYCPDSSCHDSLQNWSSVVMQQVDLVDYDQSHKLGEALVSALARNNVPLLRGAHYHLCSSNLLLAQLVVTCQLTDGDAVLLQALAKVARHLGHQRLHWRNVHNFKGVQIQHTLLVDVLADLSQDAHHGHVCLSSTCGGTQQHIFIAVQTRLV
eukprot:comp22998_c0_seq1/m.36625 comp22998_c0_seq1/g.36625  ORF comp22998_c0_seq1/g.36625 comp22998_c0_seq1/m.36625 type:complete len:337 (+) comp22998_c0_seq1:3951-4961(+)